MTVKVKIGDYLLDQEIQPTNADGSVPTGRPNPTRITWSKDNIIKIHEIPWPKHKTSRTSDETLWNLDIEFNIFTSTDLDTIRNMVTNGGPYFVVTAFLSTYMYIKNASFTQQAGTDDYYQNCSMKLVECND